MRSKVFVVATCLLALSVSPAHAAQLDPKAAPTVTGPIVEDSDSYDGKRCTRRQIPGAGDEVAAIAKFCWTFFRFDPQAESDTERDYGIWWVQSRVNPKNGWCANKVVTQLSMSTGTVLHAISGRNFQTKRARKIAPKLTADANGASTTPATVEQSLKLFPNKLNTRLAAKTNTLKMVWTGATRRPIAAAGGVEGSWNVAEGPPVFLPGMSPRMVSDC